MVMKPCMIRKQIYSNLILLAVLAIALASAISLSEVSMGISWFYLSSPWTWTASLGGAISSFSSSSHSDDSIVDKRKRLAKEFINLERILNDECAASKRRMDQRLDKLENGLAMARGLIKETAMLGLDNNNNTTATQSNDDYIPQGEIYRNAPAFHRSYMLMQKMFKIFVYEEGEPPLFHYGPCKDIYSMEGLFLSLIEQDKVYRTRDPDQAHVFFLPFSVVMIIEHLFHPVIRDKAVLEHTLVDYVRIISHKYPYWNRSVGVDHFMLSCHDWGSRATWYVNELFCNSIRVLCNANSSEYFNPKKDASFPEINLKTGDIANLTADHASLSLNRTVLAFFAGKQYHGKLRPIIFQYWNSSSGKDEDIQVYETVPEGVSYPDMMRMSKYCLCPSGHEVASPRIVEAIYSECVPVLISQHYVLPFSDVLNWNSFSLSISVGDIPNLKSILLDIPQHQYLRLKANVKQVQRHFLVNDPPKKYDVFNMIVHSIWLRRMNVQIYS